ncbi:MAG: glycine--tRNA ligase subunit beta [Gammaproteobacteria bacterium]
MTTGRHLLFELGTEELPPKNLLKLSNALLDSIRLGLEKNDLAYGASKAYATPRRLAVSIENLAIAQPDRLVEKRGPALQAAFSADGSPSKAAEGFASSCGTTVDRLERLKTEKGEWLAYRQQVKGQGAEALIPEIIRQSILALPIAKRMRWGSNTAEFVRPAHWVLLIFDDKVIPAEILGLKSGNVTYGHRFHAPEPIVLGHASEYGDSLYRKGKVIADFDRRKSIILEEAQKAASAVQGKAHIEEELLEEIAALNEWPVPVTGTFDRRYLQLPAEVLITTMQTNQKYFPVKGENQELLPYFITFSNIASTRPESIRRGNERVILPRLADAEFFWNQDNKLRLDERVLDLNKIIFQQTLGSLADKTRRIENLAERIALQLSIDSAMPRRAALLSKTDLLTSMVGEFPGLQGVMGRYYALNQGEDAEVADALEEQYFPKQSGGPTPESATGQILAVADKLDTLTGIFSAGLIPTGDKDPYALRRAALGILRVLIERRLDIDLVDLIDFALNQFEHGFDREQTRSQVVEFIYDRLKGYCLERGYGIDEFEAVLSVFPAKPLDFELRLQAVKEFRQLPEALSLTAANKRIRNILRKSDAPHSQSISGLVEEQEIKLLSSAEKARKDVSPLLESRDYRSVLKRLAELKSDVDAFFDHVMVNCEDPKLKAQRLALLSMLSDLFLQIADISKLQA